MKAGIFVRPGQIEVQDEPMPQIKQPTDAIIRVLRTCVCGSDLWWYRGITTRRHSSLIGHEAIGIVTAVGSAVTAIHSGDFVIAPCTHGCGHCIACRSGCDDDCYNHAPEVNGGYQGEYFRFTNANWALVKIPGTPADYRDDQLNSLLTLADVMATGYHAAVSAEVKAGATVAVVGDGAVGLCGVIAAKMRGAKRILALSSYPDRQRLAIKFGATDIVAERGVAALEHVQQLTAGDGVDAALECVGTDQAIKTAAQICHPGAVVGRVGLAPHPVMNINSFFNRNVGLRGGGAPVTTYDKRCLLTAVLQGKINPGRVFNARFDLEHLPAAYQTMDKRRAIKALVVVNDE